VTDFVASDGFRQAVRRKRAKSCRRSLARSQQEPRAVSDVELLAIVLDLQSIVPAAALLDRLGSLARIERAGVAELVSTPGIDRPRAERILAALALGRRLAAEPRERQGPLRTAEDVWRRFGARVAGAECEHFWALALDARLHVIAEREIAMGSANAVAFFGRDAFRALVAEGAVAAIFVHNHPSGDPTPSETDRELSARLVEGGRLLGIRVIDHVVVTRDHYASALLRVAREVTL